MARSGRHSRHSLRNPSPSTLAFTLLIAFSFVVLILLGLGIVSLPSTNSPGNSNSGHDLNSMLHTSMHRGEISKIRGHQWVELLSWEPRAFVYHNFLSKEECEYLIELAKPHMLKSEVIDNDSGKGIDSRVRTSSGTFLPRERDKIVSDIEKRIADWTFIPVDHGEGLQVLHYEAGQKYEPHYDYFMDEFSTVNGGQRIATVLMYLSDVEQGGETVFPDIKVNQSDVPDWNKLSKCGKGGMSIRPKMGDALLFWSMKPDGHLDPLSLHAGCPVIRGNKWSSTKWMRVNEFRV
ncbi:hypothetical protein V2J09_002287 [Rumex salicifolius]